MAENKRDPEGEQEREVRDFDRPEVRHETVDVDARAVTRFGIALVILCIGALLLLGFVFNYFLHREEARNPKPPSAGVNVDARRLPPEPRLQPTPILDLKQMQAAEDQILRTYGWLDQGRGVARIPIEDAMDILARKGLPSRPQAGPQSAASNVSVPTESGLGTVMQRPGGPLAEGTER
jgi:hypothetical protein